MTKYISAKGACRVSNWHYDKECAVLKAGVQEATESVIEYHDLSPCVYCTDETKDYHQKQNWQYQQVEIDPENDPLEKHL